MGTVIDFPLKRKWDDDEKRKPRMGAPATVVILPTVRIDRCEGDDTDQMPTRIGDY